MLLYNILNVAYAMRMGRMDDLILHLALGADCVIAKLRYYKTREQAEHVCVCVIYNGIYAWWSVVQRKTFAFSLIVFRRTGVALVVVMGVFCA